MYVLKTWVGEYKKLVAAGELRDCASSAPSVRKLPLSTNERPCAMGLAYSWRQHRSATDADYHAGQRRKTAKERGREP